MRRLRIVLLQLALAVVSTLAAAELTLQLLGLTKSWWASRAVPAATSETYTILCLGDSHTYGAPLPRDESYPSQLQARLDAAFPGDYRVINLGAPGANSAMVARHFAENVRRHRPDLVILWVGVNNAWNPTDTERWDGAQRGPVRRALDQSKLL
ncbi:MAG: GDSL-type esterase/lipase family protein, partial [Myxococcota bacterium]